MKEEELIKKLESVDLPSAGLEDHRRQLKAALLAGGHLPRKRRVIIWESLTSRLVAVPDLVVRGLKSPQPAWKVLALSAVALSLVLSLVIAVPFLTSESPAAMAADIARNSPEVKEALGESDFRVLHVQVGTIPVVTFEGSSGSRVVAVVDVENRKVTSVTVLSPPDMQRAIDIAMTDTTVQELLANGASFVDVEPVFFQSVVVTRDNSGETVFCANVIQGRVVVALQQGDERWAIHVDLVEGRVVGGVMELS